MGARRKWVQIALLICLVTLQLQVYAVNLLPCQHTGGASSHASTAGLAAACPHVVSVQQTASEDAGAAFGHCQKCALDLCVFGGLALPPEQPTLAATRSAPYTPGGQRHFYLFSPDPGLKPPIPISG